MQKHKKIFSILLVLITIACIVWLIVKGNEENFWNVRFFEIISIYLTTILGLIGLFITLFILEYNNEERICDVIQHCGSYGNRQDLLEIMGGLTEEEQENDSVLGYLTAEEVFKRFKQCYDNGCSTYKNLEEE